MIANNAAHERCANRDNVPPRGTLFSHHGNPSHNGNATLAGAQQPDEFRAAFKLAVAAM
jgi:hypothetical protein